MNRCLSTALVASLCVFGTAVHAQDKEKSLPSGQQKVTPDTPMGKSASQMPASPGYDGMRRDGAMHDSMANDSKMVDANGDGMVSKAEFMKHAEAQWTSMKKDSKGMVKAADFNTRPMAPMMPK